MTATAKRVKAKRTPSDARALEVRRLRRMGSELRSISRLIDLAATYWEDGAHETARDILRNGRGRSRSVVRQLLSIVRAVNLNKWHVE